MLKINQIAAASCAFGAALALAACGDESQAPEPAGEDTAAMMPDTSVEPTNTDGTVPDAGETGVAEPTTTPPDPQEPST